MFTSANSRFFWVYLYIYITCGSIIAHSFELFISCIAVQIIIVYSIVCTVYIHCICLAFYLCYVQCVFLFFLFFVDPLLLWQNNFPVWDQKILFYSILFYSILFYQCLHSRAPKLGPSNNEDLNVLRQDHDQGRVRPSQDQDNTNVSPTLKL